MSTKGFSLIVVSADDPNIWKIHISPRVVVVLVLAFLISFCVTVAVTYGLREDRFSEAEYGRLQKENRSLWLETRNASLKTQKLRLALSDIEASSERIETLIETTE